MRGEINRGSEISEDLRVFQAGRVVQVGRDEFFCFFFRLIFRSRGDFDIEIGFKFVWTDFSFR